MQMHSAHTTQRRQHNHALHMPHTTGSPCTTPHTAPHIHHTHTLHAPHRMQHFCITCSTYAVCAAHRIHLPVCSHVIHVSVCLLACTTHLTCATFLCIHKMLTHIPHILPYSPHPPTPHPPTFTASSHMSMSAHVCRICPCVPHMPMCVPCSPLAGASSGPAAVLPFARGVPTPFSPSLAFGYCAGHPFHHDVWGSAA